MAQTTTESSFKQSPDRLPDIIYLMPDIIYLMLISFLLLRTVALIQLHYTPEQIMNARIIGYFPSGRGGCTKWILLLENQDRVRICRTGSSFDINTNRFLKVSVKQTVWAYEIHYLNHFSTMPDKP